MKKVLIATTICTAMLASCGQNSAEYKKLKAENDSLRIENTKSNAEMDEILGTLNDVEADIQSIRDAENYLNIQQQKGDLNKSNREQIKENMQLISETPVSYTHLGPICLFRRKLPPDPDGRCGTVTSRHANRKPGSQSGNIAGI